MRFKGSRGLGFRGVEVAVYVLLVVVLKVMECLQARTPTAEKTRKP